MDAQSHGRLTAIRSTVNGHNEGKGSPPSFLSPYAVTSRYAWIPQSTWHLPVLRGLVEPATGRHATRPTGATFGLEALTNMVGPLQLQ
ncbi:hypothetical protein R1flu_021532 [Riccia fluitans]|uniref:Uncharacterized protein n=1 Tax=Riccia fluitans TaxID=41844 RepID=A0ABD1ZST0_9MARC